LAKRTGTGGKQRGGGKGRGSRKTTAGRNGRRVQTRTKQRSGQAGRGRANRSRAGSPNDRSTPNGREAIVREIESPDVRGQRVRAEDRDGRHWHIECLGEPVEVGARISFQVLGSEDDHRGEMLRLLDQKRLGWVCTLHKGRGGIELTPFGGVEAPSLQLSESDSKRAPDGMRVLVVPASAGGRARAKRSSSLETTGKRGRSRQSSALRVRVAQLLGMPCEPDADHRALVWKYRLATAFSRRARIEVDEIEDRLSADELERRLDLRHLPFITIDPASARDHDDAVFAERRPERSLALVRDDEIASVSAGEDQGRRSQRDSKRNPSWTHRLWVAIADVSHFVKPTGWVDAEARRRGNSFYFPDRSIPMLPERLSSDLCSLRSGVDRLALVVELRIDSAGEVADALFHEAVVRSCAGLSYEDAAKYLSEREEADGPEHTESPDWGDSLLCLEKIAGCLTRSRVAAGALSLELPDVEIEVDEIGRPIDARLRERNAAHTMIEEAMLAANRAVARALDRARSQAIHRVHPPPRPAKLAALSALLDRLGIEVDSDLEEPGVLAELLMRVRDDPSEERIHLAVLRSMSQARYESESRGHYALRFEHYVHFTSPIRRYADLEVHRALKRLIRGDSGERTADSKFPDLAERLSVWLSGRERVATEVEREAEALACCALLHDRKGDSFEANVTGVTEFGLFVRLVAPAASGLVPMRALEGYWTFDAEDESLSGERSGRRIGLGDRLFVELVEVDVDRARVSFRLASAKEGSKRRRAIRRV